MHHTSRTVALVCALLVGIALSASAEFSQYDTATYDYFALGAPKFVKTDYIDLNKVTEISKFRSYAGHDYSDFIEFGSADAYKFAGYGPIESCRNMKHYYVPPDDNTVIRAPVSGVISRIFEEELGTQIHITSDVQPAFTFAIFHVVTPAKVEVGMRVEEGQVLGHHWGQQTFSDMAVMVHTPKGYHLISYFETMTDDLFATYQARGIATREQMSISKETVDADLNRCSEFSSDPTVAANFVSLTGGAATQTITVPSDFNAVHHVGDTYTAKATASSGLPVTLVSNAPKVCAVQGLTVQYRRAGTCFLNFVQNGDATTFSAQSGYYYTVVVPVGAGFTGRPNVGAVFPLSATGSQSFLRFIATYIGGAVSLTLTDAATGQDKIHWTSPAIAPYTAPQFSIADIEATAPADYKRPAMYGLRIESTTTLPGTMQHVLYHPADGTITNLSTCDAGVGPPATNFYGNVHTSKLSGFPSTILYHNTSAFDFLNVYITAYDAATAARYGSYTIDVSKIALNAPVMPLNSGTVLPIATFEQTLKITPAGNHYTMVMSTVPAGGFFQHLVTNTQAGVIADMTTVCNLTGGAMAAPGVPLRGGGLFGTTQAASQSFLRFFNAGTTAGPVNLTLYDMATGNSVGQWTSPTLAPGAELQKQIGDIESALGASPKDYYDFRIDTDIDGYFQHVLWRSTDGTLTNLSTCQQGTTADPFTLLGVHSSLVAAQGYQSVINITNTGAAAQTVTLGITDARDGTRIGTYKTAAIPAGGQLLLDAGAIEAAAKITPNAAMFHYIVKADPFTGFLQHLVNNQRSGVITDMTTVCAM
jgi:hypothetical protein